MFIHLPVFFFFRTISGEVTSGFLFNEVERTQPLEGTVNNIPVPNRLHNIRITQTQTLNVYRICLWEGLFGSHPWFIPVLTVALLLSMSFLAIIGSFLCIHVYNGNLAAVTYDDDDHDHDHDDARTIHRHATLLASESLPAVFGNDIKLLEILGGLLDMVKESRHHLMISFP